MDVRVKCSCGRVFDVEYDTATKEIKAGRIQDNGYAADRIGMSGHLLTGDCPTCRRTAAQSVVAIGLQLARINEGRKRLEAAGKSRTEAIAAAVTSQMDEDERRRFPEFYFWRRG